MQCWDVGESLHPFFVLDGEIRKIFVTNWLFASLMIDKEVRLCKILTGYTPNILRKCIGLC